MRFIIMLQHSFIIDLGKEGLKSKAMELWENIVRLETEKYDLEERQGRQHYDVSKTYQEKTLIPTPSSSKKYQRGKLRGYD